MFAQQTEVNPPVTPEALPVTNDGWFPDLDLEQIKTEWRFDSTVSNERLRREVIDAMVEVNERLDGWKAVQQANGHTKLADVPATHVEGESGKVRHYRRAVAATVLAKVAAEYRDIDTLPDGAGKEARVKASLQVRIDDYWREVRWALADLQGARRTIVELI